MRWFCEASWTNPLSIFSKISQNREKRMEKITQFSFPSENEPKSKTPPTGRSYFFYRVPGQAKNTGSSGLPFKNGDGHHARDLNFLVIFIIFNAVWWFWIICWMLPSAFFFSKHQQKDKDVIYFYILSDPFIFNWFLLLFMVAYHLTKKNKKSFWLPIREVLVLILLKHGLYTVKIKTVR